jgi:MFS family permease
MRTADVRATAPFPAERAAVASTWSPLRNPIFRALWVATVVSNIGTWMHNVGAAWLMTSLAPSPTMVALVQAATSLPVFLVGLPAGALADMVDRRRFLLVTQDWMLVAAAVLGALTLADLVTPWGLLVLTFALGLGAAMNAPAWQAIVPELVPRSELHTAIALNSIAFNIARVIGPALGGLVIAGLGSGAVFLLNAISFLGVMIVLYRWQRFPQESHVPAEHITGAIRAGLRYVRHAPALRIVLVRSCVFILCGSALWALLPLVARGELGLDATGYGVLLGSLGAGAIAGAIVLARIRQRLASDPLVAVATVLFAAATLLLASTRNVALLCGVMAMAGMAWMALMSTLNAAAQTTVPAWVRARAMAVYLLLFQGGMAVGSTLWGAVASHVGIPLALFYAALGLIVGLAVMVRYRLTTDDEVDLTPSMHWHDPPVASELRLEDGPVLVTVEYHIDPQRMPEFVQAMQALRLVRRRDGAIRWGLFSDTANPSRCVETFVVESWAEHLRQHERFTMTDRIAEEQVRAFHIGEEPPKVSHLLSAHVTDDAD